jgi:hypothetical protein
MLPHVLCAPRLAVREPCDTFERASVPNGRMEGRPAGRRHSAPSGAHGVVRTRPVCAMISLCAVFTPLPPSSLPPCAAAAAAGLRPLLCSASPPNKRRASEPLTALLLDTHDATTRKLILPLHPLPLSTGCTSLPPALLLSMHGPAGFGQLTHTRRRVTSGERADATRQSERCEGRTKRD